MKELDGMLSGVLGVLTSDDFFDTREMAKRAQIGLARDAEFRRAEAEIIAAPFRTPDGRRCLEALLRHVVMQRLTLPIKGTTLEEQALHAAERQGQNQIIAFLFQQLAIADGERVEEQEG